MTVMTVMTVMTARVARYAIRLLNATLIIALAFASTLQTPTPVASMPQMRDTRVAPRHSQVNAHPPSRTDAVASQIPLVYRADRRVLAIDRNASTHQVAAKAQRRTLLQPAANTALAQSTATSVTMQLLFDKQASTNNTVLTGTMLVFGGQFTATPTSLKIYLNLPDGLTYVNGSAQHTWLSTGTGYNSVTRRITFTYTQNYTGAQVLTATWRMNLSAPAVPSNLTITGTASDSRCCAVTPATLPVYAPSDSSHTVTPAGGVVALTSRMTLDFPPGAVDANVDVSGADYAFASMPSSGQLPSATLRLELHPALTFLTPVTLTVTLTDPAMQQFLMDQSWPGLQFIDPVTHQTEVISATFDPLNGKLVAPLTHFSPYEVQWRPAEPQPWKLASHGGQVSAFRGSLTYASPIQVPAAPGGIAPQLVFGYSSVAADSGVDESRSPYKGWSLGAASPGWTMSVPKITRLVRTRLVEVFGDLQASPGQLRMDVRGNLYNASGQWITETVGATASAAYCAGPEICQFQGWKIVVMNDYRNEFMLDLGGVSYALVPQDGSNTRYYTQPYTPMRVYRCNARSGNPPECNPDGWQDTTVDREWWRVWTTDGTRYVLGGDAMGTRFYEGDGAGGSIDTYDPATASGADYAGGQPSRVPVGWFVRKVYVPPANGGSVGAEYRYTNTTNILLNTITYGPTVAPNGTPVNSGDFFTLTFSYTGSTLNTLQVNTRSGRLRRYLLANGTGKLLNIEEQGLDNETGRLITRLSYDNIDGRTLLTSIDNNYGVTWRYTYISSASGNAHVVVSSTTTIVGERKYSGPPIMGKVKLVYAASTTTTYEYAAPCYDHASDACHGDATGACGESYGLIGFGLVTETTRHSNSPTEERSARVFDTERPFIGQLLEARNLDSALTTLSRQRTEYRAFTSTEISVTAAVTFVAAVSTTIWPGGDAYPAYFKHMHTSYDLGLQGGTFQGLPTGVEEYDGSYAIPYRHSESAFVFDTNTWLSRPISEAVYDASGTRLSERRYYYEGQAFGILTTPGRLTFVQDLGKLDAPGGPRTQDAQLSYDALGNVTGVTTWKDYGTPGVTHANGRVSILSSAGYDDQYGLFVTVITNAARHTERYYYYGVNALPLLSPTDVYEGRQPFGSLQFVQGPNGPAAGTRYEYDALGRLTHVLRPGDRYDSPSVEYQYFDANNEFATGYDFWGEMGGRIGEDFDRYAFKWSGLKVKEYRRGFIAGGLDLPYDRRGYHYYDGLGRLLQQRVPNDAGPYTLLVTSFDYDGAGRTLRATLPYIQETFDGNLDEGEGTGYDDFTYQPPDWGVYTHTQTEYDALGRVSTITSPDKTQLVTGYYGPVTVVTDALGRARSTTADIFGRLTAVTEPSTGSGSSTTSFQYDAQDHLTRLTDPLGHLTELWYDDFGRKAQTDDPDMGTWQYSYDAANNLVNQTDARGQTLWFGYDNLNRLTEKRLIDAAGTVLATYGYDAGDASANGIGQRTSMSNAESSTTWQYDTRGRLSQTYITVTGIAGWPMDYSYNQQDQVLTVEHPNAEQIRFHYDHKGLPTSFSGLIGTTNYDYISETRYNALGQPTWMRYAGPTLTTRYVYYGLDYQWGDPNRSFGRLRQLCVIATSATDPDPCALGSYTSTGALLNNAYAYDDAGNLTVLRDDINGQRQEFQYDALDRLTTAVPSQTFGLVSVLPPYTETYSYDAIGNMTSRNGVSYNYSATQPHAVSALSTGATFQYDANGNMIVRAEVNGSQRVTYTHAWDAENRMAAVFADGTPAVVTHFGYDADGRRLRRVAYADGAAIYTDTFDVYMPTQWTYSALAEVPYDDPVDGPVLKLTGNSAYLNTLRITETLSSGDSAHIDFRVGVTNSGLLLMLENGRDTPTYSRLALMDEAGKLVVQYRLNGGAWVKPQTVLPVLQADTWYRVTLRADDTNGFKLEARQRDGCATADTGCAGAYTHFMPTGKTWRFGVTIYKGTAYLDHYAERHDVTSQLVHITPSFDRLSAGGVTTRTAYYELGVGGPRVAMRVFTDTGATKGLVYWLHSDHLGSASLTTYASKSSYSIKKTGEMRYLPFGETRWASGELHMDRLFTGQRWEAGLGGLYDYGDGTRFYSPALGRFISPDSLVPDPLSPQSLNRYTYARNSPLTRIDPTGHADFLADLVNFVKGASMQYSDDVSWGAQSALNTDVKHEFETNGSQAFTTGRQVGRIASTLQGFYETLSGGSMMVGGLFAGAGVAVAGCVGSALIGCPVAVAGGGTLGVGMVGAGTVIAGHGVGTLLSNAKRPIPSNAMLSQFDSDGNEVPDSWANPDTFVDHATRHGPEFKAKSQVDYANKAHTFYGRFKSGAGGIESAEGYGQLYLYEKKTNTLGIYVDKGKTVTFMKPRPNYWGDLLEELGYK